MYQQVKMFYEAPTTEVVAVKSDGILCSSPKAVNILLGLPDSTPDGISDYEGSSLTW